MIQIIYYSFAVLAIDRHMRMRQKNKLEMLEPKDIGGESER